MGFLQAGCCSCHAVIGAKTLVKTDHNPRTGLICQYLPQISSWHGYCSLCASCMMLYQLADIPLLPLIPSSCPAKFLLWIVFSASYLHCFDDVGLALGRASGPWVMRCYKSGAMCKFFAYGPVDATAISKPIIPYLIENGFTVSRWYWLT